MVRLKKVRIRKGKNNITEVKKRKHSILCIILGESKSCNMLWVEEDRDSFSFGGNTYFVVSEGAYIKDSIRVLVFLEGISTPVHHGYIERKMEKRKIVDRDSNEERVFNVNVIKGLKFDSKLIDMLLNRHLADEFTRQHMDLPNLAIILLLLGNVVLNIVGLYMWFR